MTGFNVPVQSAVMAWAKTVNESGGLNGRQVEIVAKDDGLNPGTALTAAKKLVSDRVAAIVNMSMIDQTWAATVEKAKIPVVGVFSNTKPFETSPYFFPEGQTGGQIHKAVVAIAKGAGATNLGFMYCAEAPVCAESVPKLTATGKAQGVPVVYNTKISSTAPNYTAQCVAARQQGVSALYIGSSSAIAAKVAADCSRQGWNPIYITQGAAFGMNMVSVPGLSQNLWMQFATLPFFADTPAVRAFNTAMDKHYPGVRQNTSVFIHNAFMGWVSAKLLEQAIRSSGAPAGEKPTATQVVKGLESLKDYTVDGLAPPLTFEPGKPHKVDCWFTAQVKNGKPVVANGGKVTCAS
jgi:branched-chain amino acid transport system substrate-binding protein